MALVGTRVETMREGNTNLAVKTDILLDPETGLVVERKTVVASVQTEDGRTAVITGQKTTVACAVQPRRSPVPQRRAIQAAPVQQQTPQYIIIAPEPSRQTTPQHVTRQEPPRPQYTAPPSPQQHYNRRRTTEDKCAIHCAFCFLCLFFPPLFCCWIIYCCSSDDDL